MQASNNNFFKMAIESQELIFPETIPFLNEALHDNEKKRRKLNSILKKYVNFRLPKKTVTYYNSLFQEAEKAVKGQFKSPSTKPTINAIIDNAYSIRLTTESTLVDLIQLDVFHDKTVSLDFKFDEVLSGKFPMDWASEQTRRASIYHFFYHRPQKSIYLFLHELIVGYLVNLAMNPNWKPRRDDVDLFSRDYNSLLSYALVLLSKILKKDINIILELHFLDTKEIEKLLPKPIRQVLLASAQLYWYLDHWSVNKKPARTPAILLMFIGHFFTIPLFERTLKQQLKLKRNAGKIINLTFADIIKNDRQSVGQLPNDYEIASRLIHLNEMLFE